MNLKFAFSSKMGFLLVAVACPYLPAIPAFGAGTELRTIHVISNGWHTSVVVKRQDIASNNIPELADFPVAKYMEFGWGDAEYFPAKRTTFGTIMRAAFTSTPAVMHVVGSFRRPASRYPTAEIIELSISLEGLSDLVQYIHNSFERHHLDRAKLSDPGLYINSLFYPATGRFYIGNTCNSWTAKVLNAAGFDVDNSVSALAAGLMFQLRQIDKAP